MSPSRVCTLRLTPLLFWLMFHAGSASESDTDMPERARTDTAAAPAPANVTTDPAPEEIMSDVELLSDLDILMDLEFLELLEMLETENLNFPETVERESQHDSAG